MTREELSLNDFKPHEIVRLQTHLDDLMPIFNTPELRDIDTFIEGGVGRGIFALLLIQNVCKQLQLLDTRYVGFDVLSWVSGGKERIDGMSDEDIRAAIGRQPSFSPHGVVMYHEGNKDHCISGGKGDIYSDNNVLYGDCFRPDHVNKVMSALDRKKPVFVEYNATGALLDGTEYESDKWFQPDIPYNVWIFLSHLPTPWKLQNPAVEEFYFRESWLRVIDSCIKANLTIHLLRNGIAALR